MDFTYKKAGISDLNLLVKTRIQVLRAANLLEESADLSEVEWESEDYYRKSLTDGSHTAFLVFDRDKFAGAGGISFFRVMPTVHNSSGRKAYIMNMYTVPEYRRRGIALKTLKLLVREAQAKGINHITLEATEAGRPLYENFGFVSMPDEMMLPETFFIE